MTREEDQIWKIKRDERDNDEERESKRDKREKLDFGWRDFEFKRKCI